MNTKVALKNKSIFTHINWRIFRILLALVVFGLLALIPYGLTVADQNFSPDMIPQLLSQFIVQLFLYSALIIGGLLMGQKVGLGTPILTNIAEGKEPGLKNKTTQLIILSGLGAGFLMIILDLYVFAPQLQDQIAALGDAIHPPAWQGFFASFYGGIVEEVMSRFFLLTLLVWIGSKISRSSEGKPSQAVIWIAILISGLIFGIAHLPSAAVMGVQLTPLYIVRTLALNGVGILYGWLYWKHGLESAMLSHFSTDIVVHVIGALLLA